MYPFVIIIIKTEDNHQMIALIIGNDSFYGFH